MAEHVATLPLKTLQNYLATIFLFNKSPTLHPHPQGIFCQAVDPSNTRYIETLLPLETPYTGESFSIDIDRIIKLKTSDTNVTITNQDNTSKVKSGRTTLSFQHLIDKHQIREFPNFKFKITIPDITPDDLTEMMSSFISSRKDTDKALRFYYEPGIFKAAILPDKSVIYELPVSTNDPVPCSSKFSLDLTTDLTPFFKTSTLITVMMADDIPIRFKSDLTEITVAPRISED